MKKRTTRKRRRSKKKTMTTSTSTTPNNSNKENNNEEQFLRCPIGFSTKSSHLCTPVAVHCWNQILMEKPSRRFTSQGKLCLTNMENLLMRKSKEQQPILKPNLSWEPKELLLGRSWRAIPIAMIQNIQNIQGLPSPVVTGTDVWDWSIVVNACVQGTDDSIHRRNRKMDYVLCDKVTEVDFEKKILCARPTKSS